MNKKMNAEEPDSTNTATVKKKAEIGNRISEDWTCA